MAGSVLIVDDDLSVFEALREALPAGIELVSAIDAATATAMLDERTFCGLVLDLMLENSNGFDVLRHMTSKEMNVPTVVITTKLPSYVREMLDAERVKLVFPKPVEPRLLAAIVLGLCGITG